MRQTGDQVVDSSDNTNVSTALVERDGKFWFEELPLTAGTSSLTLTAEDFWGNLTTTNISVSKSDVELTIDPVSESLLNEARITVTGRINVSDHTVWVNGVKWTDYWSDGSGGLYWQADDVSMTPGGTAVIQARAIPNTDHEGNGTPGSGGTVATMQDPGNPDSPEAKDDVIEPDKPWQLYMETDDIFVQDSYEYSRFDYYSPPPNSQLSHWSSSELTKNYSHHWEYDPEAFTESGTGTIYDLTHYEYSDDSPYTSQVDTTFYWPAEGGEPDQAYATYVHQETGSNPYTTYGWLDVPHVYEYDYTKGEHCEVQNPPPTDEDYWEDYMYERIHKQLHNNYTRNAQTVWKFCTGGKAKPKRENLWVFSGDAWEILDKKAQRPLDYASKVTIASQRITMGELGRLGSDGLRYKVLPDNAPPIDVTPRVDGLDFYVFDVDQPQKYILRIKANDDIVLEPDRIVDDAIFCVGQKVTFREDWSPGTPPGIASTPSPEYDWIASAKCYNYESPANSAGCKTYENHWDLWRVEQPFAWWVSGGNKNVRLKLKLTFSNGQTATPVGWGKFDMYRPQCRIGEVKDSHFFVTDTHWSGKCYLRVGSIQDTYKIDFDVQVKTSFTGDMGESQICTLNYSNPHGQVSGALDGVEFYRSARAFSAVEWNLLNLDDKPGSWDWSPNRVEGSFVEYVRFRPDVGGYQNNIFVTLGVVQNGHGCSWDILGVATLTNDNWNVDPDQVRPPTSVDSSDAFPTWTEVFQRE